MQMQTKTEVLKLVEDVEDLLEDLSYFCSLDISRPPSYRLISYSPLFSNTSTCKVETTSNTHLHWARSLVSLRQLAHFCHDATVDVAKTLRCAVWYGTTITPVSKFIHEYLRYYEIVPRNLSSPLILHFQNGYASSKFKAEKCALLKNKTDKRTLVTEVAGLLYSGQEDNQDISKTLVLARNKVTGKVRLIEASCVELAPVLNIEQRSSEFDTSYLELSRKFGSKKQKKIVEQKEKLKVNVSTVTKQMHNVTVNVTDEQKDLSSYIKSDSDAFYIPPINRDAAKVNEIYDLYKILSKEQYTKIYSEIDGTNYYNELLPWIQNKFRNKELSKEHTVLMLYADTLLKLFLLGARDITKKTFIICTNSQTLNEIVLNNFTNVVNGKRTRSVQLKDKAFCHAMVFLLLINDYKFNISEISENIKFSIRTILTKLRVIGATIITSGESKTANLKLPLPSVSQLRRKSAKF
ncbi:hypothetical protein ACJJTC_009371 [Scirpophaga incertulas]